MSVEVVPETSPALSAAAQAVDVLPSQNVETAGDAQQPLTEAAKVDLLKLHVDAVRADGDALSTPFMLKSSWRLIGVAAALGGVEWTTAGDTESVAGTAGLAATVLGLAIATIIKPSRTEVATLAAKRAAIPVQKALDACYELYIYPDPITDDKKRRAVAALWHGPLKNGEDKPLPDLLEGFAELAKEAGVDSIILTQAMSDLAVGPGAPRAARITYQEWLRSQRDVRINTIGKNSIGGTPLHSKTPDQWLELAREAKPQDKELVEITRVLTELRSLMPDHPIHGVAQKYAKASPEVRKAVLRSELESLVRQRIINDLTTSTRMFSALSNKANVAHATRTGRLTADESGWNDVQFKDGKVVLVINGQKKAPVSLAKAMGFIEIANAEAVLDELPERFDPDTIKAMDDPAQKAEALRINKVRDTAEARVWDVLQDLLNNPAYGFRRVTAYEYALLKMLQATKPVAQNQTADKQAERPGYQPAADVKTFQSYGKEGRISFWPHRLRNIGRAVMAFGMTGALLAGINTVGDELYAHREQQAAQDIARERGLDPSVLPVDYREIDKRVDSWAGLNGDWHDWTTVRSSVGDALRQDGSAVFDYLGNLFSGGQDSGGDSHHTSTVLDGPQYSGVGNVEVTNDADADLTLIPHGLDPTGYWLSAVPSIVVGNGAHDGQPASIAWDLRSNFDVAKVYDNVPFNISQFPFLQRQVYDNKWIEVHANVDISKSIKVGKNTYIPLPVLQHTAPIALNIDGTKDGTGIVVLKNGTYAIDTTGSMPGQGAQKLTYWLAVSNQNLPFAHSTGNIELKGDMIRGQSPEQLRAIFDAIPRFKQAPTGTKRRLIVGKYIKDNVHYSKIPFSDEDLQHIDKWAQFLVEELYNDEGDCNTAATTVAIASDGGGVQVATGWYNGPGAGQTALTVGERHEVNVTGSGVEDYTPSPDTPVRRIEAAPAPGQSREGELRMPPEAQDAIELLSLLAAATTAFLSRRRIVYVAQKGSDGIVRYRANRANEKLKATDTEALRRAVALVEQLALARGGAIDSQQTERALARLAGIDPRERLSQLAGSTVVRLHLREQRDTIAKPDYKTIARANRAATRPQPRTYQPHQSRQRRKK